MSDDAPKSRAELRRMFWHDFAGTISDNMVEETLQLGVSFCIRI